MSTHLETADRVVREIEPSAVVASREASVTLMAESFGSGVTPDQVRDLRRLSQPPAAGKPPASADTVASAAKGLSLIEEARLPVPEGTAVMAEAVKQGFRSNEILSLAREVKRREADYRAGRASLTRVTRLHRARQSSRAALPRHAGGTSRAAGDGDATRRARRAAGRASRGASASGATHASANHRSAQPLVAGLAVPLERWVHTLGAGLARAAEVPRRGRIAAHGLS